MTPTPTAIPLAQQIHDIHTSLRIIASGLLVLIALLFLLVQMHRHGPDGRMK